jgi:hypothetical protein
MTPQQQQLQHLAKARRVRQAKAKQNLWAKVREHKQATKCTCDLRPGMTWEDLRELGAGCTADRYFVCSTLDCYRALVTRPK